MTRRVYRFDEALPEAALPTSGPIRGPEALVGVKGAGLRALVALGIPVPPGFTLTTEVFRAFERGGALPDDGVAELRAALVDLEARTGRRLDGDDRPLLVSVRSGAPASMPGMLDTVLDLGLNDRTTEALADETGDRRFALDAYRRLLAMFGSVVMGVPRARFEDLLGRVKIGLGQPRMLDAELPVDALAGIVEEHKRIIATEAGVSFPEDPFTQLVQAIGAVFRSWHNARAVRYRNMLGIDPSLGTACTVQAMVFGNRGPTSGSGVAFTRNPSSGDPVAYGEFLPNAQGEDVVSGLVTPFSLARRDAAPGRELSCLEASMPDAFATLVAYGERLEHAFGDVQELEFTIEEGRVFLLQTRTAKRTARAAVRFAHDLVAEGRVDEDRALASIDATTLDQLFRARLPSAAELATRGVHPVATGLPASPGAATGIVVFDADEAVRRTDGGEDVLLVRRDTSPEDVHGMRAAVGVLTSAGGMTSHAAVVARGLGKCCITGCSTLQVDPVKRTVVIRGRNGEAPVEVHAGDVLTLDGDGGRVYLGAVDAIAEAAVPELAKVMSWADARRRLRVRALADSVPRALAALRAGAEGIGLFSMDGQLASGAPLRAAQAMLLADDPEDAEPFEARLEALLTPDLVSLLRGVAGRPVVVRLFDDVLHRIVPAADDALAEVAADVGASAKEIARRARALTEVRPGLGLRGVRLGLTHPGIYRAQVRAIANAASTIAGEGARPDVEIAIPGVATAREFAAALALVRAELARPEVAGPHHREIPVGAIVGVPHACLDASEIAALSEFLIFDTHELTQTVFGMGREDARMYMHRYVHELHVFDADPFVRFDETGVGSLIRAGAEQARRVHPGIRLEVAGEVAGEPAATDLAEQFGMDCVACPTARLAVAKLSAAQAVIHTHVAPANLVPNHPSRA